MAEPILSATGLSKHFILKGGAVLPAVSAIDLDIHANECVALVGESGSGKTTLSRLLLLLDHASSGTLRYFGRDVSQLTRAELRQFRRDVQPVFQNPFSSLNPRLRVRHIVAEPLQVQDELSNKKIQILVGDALEATGLSVEDGEKFPHQFSGGQRQRIAIARAIISKPKLIILDEPVSSQDISIQAQILNLLKDLQQELAISYLFIAHDLATVRFMSDRVAVMYLGKIVENGPSEQIFANAQHPYTQALFASVLPVHPQLRQPDIAALGEIPSPINPPKGCTFHPRCAVATAQCAQHTPTMKYLAPTHVVREDSSRKHLVHRHGAACWRLDGELNTALDEAGHG